MIWLRVTAGFVLAGLISAVGFEAFGRRWLAWRRIERLYRRRR
jgi:hypothetical protein